MSGEMQGGVKIDAAYMQNYLKSLVNRFFKILPMRETEEPTLQTYMDSLKNELIGFERLPTELDGDAMFMSLLATLQYLIDHTEASQYIFKREVFKSISICNRLRAKIGGGLK